MNNKKQIRVLYIEDNAGHARLLTKRLEKKGGEYLIDWVDDAMEGLKKVKYKQGYYDIVLVDYNLKGKSGIEAIRQIKTYESAPPTVLITASGNEEVAVEALQSGASNYLIKDIDFNYLDLLPIVICETISKRQLEEDKKRAEELIQHMAFHDSLTGLPNRRTFFDRLSVEIAEAKRYKQKFAVIFIDLDNFKEINDSLGHEIGDKVLQTVTREMSKHLRESDTLARTGGDEFILLIPKIKKTEDAQTVAEKFLKTFQKPLIIDAHEIPIGLSMGASFYPKNGKEPDILVKKADEAMYKAKQSGRNNFKIS